MLSSWPGVPNKRRPPIQETMVVTTSKPRRRSRKRTFLMTALVLFVGVAVVGGAYAWRMVDTIVHAEKSAVVPLPPSDSDLAWENEVVPTATVPTGIGSDTSGAAVGTETPIDVRAPDTTVIAVSTTTASRPGGQLPTGPRPARSARNRDASPAPRRCRGTRRCR